MESDPWSSNPSVQSQQQTTPPKPPKVRSKYATSNSKGKRKDNKDVTTEMTDGVPVKSAVLDELRQARAMVESLQLELRTVKVELDSRRQQVGQIRGDVIKEEARFSNLLDQKVVDDREFGKLKGAYEVARAELAELRKQLAAARAEVEEMRERGRTAAVAQHVVGKRAAQDAEEGDRAVEESRRMMAADRAVKEELEDQVRSLREQLEVKRLEVDAGLRLRQELREEKEHVARTKSALAECEARLAKATSECREARQKQQRDESELRIAQATLRDERINEKERTKRLEATLLAAQEAAALSQKHCEALKADLASERQLRRVLQDKLVDVKVSADPLARNLGASAGGLPRFDSPTSRRSTLVLADSPGRSPGGLARTSQAPDPRRDSPGRVAAAAESSPVAATTPSPTPTPPANVSQVSSPHEVEESVDSTLSSDIED